MRSIIVCFLLLLAASFHTFGSEGGFEAIRLLDGYSAEPESAVDALAWTIKGKNGFTIDFEAGVSEGQAVRVEDKQKYVWYREQIVNGNKVLLALVKPGIKTVYDRDSKRGLPPGNILLVTFPLSKNKDHAANFVGKIANQEEMIDMLLMALSFDPSKGHF